MKKIENYEEFMRIWNINHKNRYWGAKKITLEHEQEIIEKANIKDFKRYSIYMLDDGYYFVLDTKPEIDSVMYYDDETEAPEKRLDVFINYNMSNFKYDMSDWEKEIKSLKENRCCSGNVEIYPFININYENSKEVYPVFYTCFGNSRRDNNTVRTLTEEETKKYIEITKELKNDYIERLTKYFYKYNKNITTYGYWANR